MHLFGESVLKALPFHAAVNDLLLGSELSEFPAVVGRWIAD